MLAVRWHGNRDVRVEDVEFDSELGIGMVEADVRYCGICGSDIAEYAHGTICDSPAPARAERAGAAGHAGPRAVRAHHGDR
jgi:(R,R)-butanediol dehydrogenase/meso-butanediol dehydrogenase/diacetyl reductase